MYCTQTDIESAIPAATVIQLTDDSGSGAADADIVADAIAKADAIIDGYCAVKYSVPLSPVPAVIKGLSVDIAIKNLYARKVEEMPAARKDAYDNAISFLKDVSRGLVSLGVDPEPEASSQGSPETNKTASDRIFTRESLRGF
jgi:phage gp36-like protein